MSVRDVKNALAAVRSAPRSAGSDIAAARERAGDHQKKHFYVNSAFRNSPIPPDFSREPFLANDPFTADFTYDWPTYSEYLSLAFRHPLPPSPLPSFPHPASLVRETTLFSFSCDPAMGRVRSVLVMEAVHSVRVREGGGGKRGRGS